MMYRSRDKDRLGSVRKRLLLALLVALAPMSLWSQQRAATLLDQRAHFIVLIDDSGDAEALQHSLLSVLPTYLYGGRDLPPFRPGRDELTMAFFTIHRDSPSNACKKDRRYSVLPEHMFEIVDTPTGSLRTRQDFERRLRASLSLPCRRQGLLSPSTAAQSLILPFLAKRLTSDVFFSRVFVIIANNYEFNTTASPVYEIRSAQGISSEPRLRDVAVAETNLKRQASLFRFQQIGTPWRRSGVFLNASEVLPLAPSPEFLVSSPSEVVLDRVAISDRQLSIGPKSPALAELRIALPEPVAVGGRLTPLRLSWSFGSERGGPWAIGRKKFPSSAQVLDLTRCSPLCRRENNQLAIPILGLGGERLLLARSDPTPQENGEFLFRVTFRYEAPGSYGYLARESPLQRVPLHVSEVGHVLGAFYSSDIVLDNQKLTDLWEQKDQEAPAGGLTQEAARERVLDQQKWSNLLFLIITIMAMSTFFAVIVYRFYLTAYHRPFRPVVEWSPAEEVMIDFDRPDMARLLIGTLIVRNPEEVPWFGQKLGNREQPMHNARLTVSFQAPEDLNLHTDGVGSPIGFLGVSTGLVGEAGLAAETYESVSDGKRIFVFLASECVCDLPGENPADGTAKIAIELAFRLEWQDRRDSVAGSVHHLAQCILCIAPEKERAPRVEFSAQKEKPFFRMGKAAEAGHLIYISQAKHKFAMPFTGRYRLQVSREHVNLAGDPIQLATPQIVLAPGEEQESRVNLVCDGELVPNPEHEEQCYEFLLIGPCASEIDRGPHMVLLRRDPTRPEIELQITYLSETFELFWTRLGTVKRRLLGNTRQAEPAVDVQNGVLAMERPFVLRFSDASPAINLLTLRVGNSATAGRGVVELALLPRLAFDPGCGDRVRLRDGWSFSELLGLYRLDEPLNDQERSVRIREAEPPQTLDLRVDTGPIDRIEGVVIEADKCRAEVDLHFTIRDDRGRGATRDLQLQLPIELEQLPGPNWLCIDFGTSAIAVAVGNALDDMSFRMIPLQDAAIRLDGVTYGREDDRNPEAGTPFLPSWVMCNADLRQEIYSQEDGWRPGSPHFRPASLQPGDPSFLSLPAVTSQLNDSPGRVIFSLKGWLGKSVREIKLRDEVRYLRNGQEVKNCNLPLDAVVESGFAALAEGYLYGEKVDQIVICHPNTFTNYHRQRLHNAASRALMRVFGIISPGHIRLISESDSVAFHYCKQRMQRGSREGKERVVVYDFGGGTLDLTVLSIEWNRVPFYPRRWAVVARTGVPIGGNYLDELLARLVDELLRDSSVCHRALEYIFPIVSYIGSSVTELHRTGILRLHRELKMAKHTWDGSSPFVLRVGGKKGGWGVLRVVESNVNVPHALADPAQPGIFEQDDFLYLSIPASRVLGDRRLAEFLEFVTDTVVSEALLSAGLQPEEIDTLIVSGRGALWPGLRERLASILSNAFVPDVGSGVAMKEAVARGAIARQSLPEILEEPLAGGRLGVLLANNDLVTEEEWRSPIDLSSSPYFRLVQVELSNPDPLRDLYSLRKHFYIDLSSQIYRREILWREDPRLFIEKVQRDGEEVIALSNSIGQTLIVHDPKAGVFIPTAPPWPVGEVLLAPE